MVRRIVRSNSEKENFYLDDPIASTTKTGGVFGMSNSFGNKNTFSNGGSTFGNSNFGSELLDGQFYELF